jgi:hypothetical protein
MRWQIWETFRGEAKGAIVFQLSSIMWRIDPAVTTTLPATSRPEVSKEAIIKTPTDAGPSSLTTIDGKVTLQFQELGKVYKTISPFTPIIHRWKATSLLLVQAESPGSSQCFIDPKTGRKYAIVRQAIRLAVETGTKKIMDLVTGKQIPLKNYFADGNSEATISLEAGAGTILEINN